MVDTPAWLPDELLPVMLRLARADQAAYALAEVALAWSRGPDDLGAVTLREIERTPGVLDLEVTAVRSVPPMAAMLFSEAVHHLRSALDNVVFYLASKEGGTSLTPEQERMVSMLIYDSQEKYDAAVKRLTNGKHALSMFTSDSELGQRMESLQPFNDEARVPSIDRMLASYMGVEVFDAEPLALLRDYSNEDKHREIRMAATNALVQTSGDRASGLARGFGPITVGTVIQQVSVGVPTGIEMSPALFVLRPSGHWVGFGRELEGLHRHVSDVVIPTLLTGVAHPDAIPAHLDLSDSGLSLRERVDAGRHHRAMDRFQAIATQAVIDADNAPVQFPLRDDV